MNFDEVRAANKQIAAWLLESLPITDSEYDNEFSFPHLRWMMERILSYADIWPLDKTGRWIGYVQGVMAIRGILDTVTERNKTRPLMQAAYQATGQIIPETAERSN